MPSLDKSLCVLPGRIDVARHFMVTGGPDGLKEPYETSVARVQSFGRYMFNVSNYPLVEDLFASPSFQNVAQSICPQEKQHLDPFQFNFIMQVPGQTVATHIDAPYFWGATRFQFPQWLLVSMVFSGLFKEDFVDQVQIVGYLHTWQPDPISNDELLEASRAAQSASAVSAFRINKPETWGPAISNLYTARVVPLSKAITKSVIGKAQAAGKRQGEFIYWETATAEPSREPPTPLAGSAVDGSKFVHAAAIYSPERAPPVMDKSASNRLEYQGNEKWLLKSNDKVLQEYETSDLRITIVYRARCFASQEEAFVYKTLSTAQSLEEYEKLLATIPPEVLKTVEKTRKLGPHFTLEEVLTRLTKEMLSRGTITKDFAQTALKSAQELGAERFAQVRLQLALKIIDTFISYPQPSLSNALLPYNYCLLSRIYPSLKPALDFICKP